MKDLNKIKRLERRRWVKRMGNWFVLVFLVGVVFGALLVSAAIVLNLEDGEISFPLSDAVFVNANKCIECNCEDYNLSKVYDRFRSGEK